MTARRIPAAALAAALLLATAACGDDDAPSSQSVSSPVDSSSPSERPTPPAGSEPSPAAEEEDGVTVRIELVDGEPAQRPEPNVDVAEGETFTLIMTSDTAQEIHVHGYDEYLDLTPGEESELTFTADQSGSWLVEVHETGAELFNLRVR